MFNCESEPKCGSYKANNKSGAGNLITSQPIAEKAVYCRRPALPPATQLTRWQRQQEPIYYILQKSICMSDNKQMHPAE